jgi:small subunit ribosomal protein S19
MARSIKKGPFADEHLLAKVEKVNKSEKKKLLKLGLAVQQFFLNL